jgi:hypothetical protein
MSIVTLHRNKGRISTVRQCTKMVFYQRIIIIIIVVVVVVVVVVVASLCLL